MFGIPGHSATARGPIQTSKSWSRCQHSVVSATDISRSSSDSSRSVSKTIRFPESCLHLRQQDSLWIELGKKRKKVRIRRRGARSTWWYGRRALSRFLVQSLEPARGLMLELLRAPQFTALSHVVRRLGRFPLPHLAELTGSTCGGWMRRADHDKERCRHARASSDERAAPWG